MSEPGVRVPEVPKGFEIPVLPTNLAEVSDRFLIDYMVRFTRYADYYSARVAFEEITESEAEKAVRRLEGLFMLRNKPEKPESGAVTMLKIKMEEDGEILAAREARSIVYARRKLQQMLLASAERDEAVCSRELTRRTEMEKGRRRSDRSEP